jgi:UDP-N-acetylmuramate--alanine ligase
VIVKGNAFKSDNIEVAACEEKGVTWQSYPDTVEEIVQQYTSIGVAGSHGKTSTTGLLATVLGEAAPTSFLIGDGDGGRGSRTPASSSTKLTNTGGTSWPTTRTTRS